MINFLWLIPITILSFIYGAYRGEKRTLERFWEWHRMIEKSNNHSKDKS